MLSQASVLSRSKATRKDACSEPKTVSLTLAETARRLVAEDLRVVVAWGPGERERAAAVDAAAGPQVELAPPTDLEELTLLLASARLVVGGDTGPVHLAASLGTPTVAVFTATDWRRNRPLGRAVEVVAAATPDRDDRPASVRAAPTRTVSGVDVARRAAELLERTRS